MSRKTTETMLTRNQNQLYGFVAQRGKAAYYSERFQGDQSNHYDGAIPIEDIKSRLFNWQAVSRRVAVELPATAKTMDHIGDDGHMLRWTVQDDRQAIVRSDTFGVMELFKKGYAPHQYAEWLIGVLSNIVGDTLAPAAAGVLRDGALAYLQIEAPENIATPEGVDFRPSILSGTSFDGKVATFYKPVFTVLRCDNQFESLRKNTLTATYKVKHSRNSQLKIEDARAALGIIEQQADEFADEIKALCATIVTDRQFTAFLEGLAPTVKDNEKLTGRALTMATNKQDTLRRLWVRDDRVSLWKNTAFGVVQAVNTYTHHEQTVKGASRAERNMINTVNGATAKTDNEALDLLGKILANA
jgi:phage/plasmid-like protein (TIGR03299 family)